MQPGLSLAAYWGITLTGIWLTHYFTLKRERASEDKMKKELHYIATELVFMLERYAGVVSGFVSG